MSSPGIPVPVVKRYDAFADMLEVHREIGYLLTIAIMLAVFDVGLLTANLIWPQEDTYIVPGVDRAGYVSVDWGVLPPDVPAEPTHTAPAKPASEIALPDIELKPAAAPSAGLPATGPAPNTGKQP